MGKRAFTGTDVTSNNESREAYTDRSPSKEPVEKRLKSSHVEICSPTLAANVEFTSSKVQDADSINLVKNNENWVVTECSPTKDLMEKHEKSGLTPHYAVSEGFDFSQLDEVDNVSSDANRESIISGFHDAVHVKYDESRAQMYSRRSYHLPVSESRCVCYAFPICDLTASGKNMCWYHEHIKENETTANNFKIPDYKPLMDSVECNDVDDIYTNPMNSVDNGQERTTS